MLRSTVLLFERIAIAFFICGVTASCSGSSEKGAISIALDSDKEKTMLSAYFGGYVSPKGGDPWAAGILSQKENEIYLHLDKLHSLQPKIAYAPQDADGDGLFVWEEIEPFIERSYYAVRAFPATLEELRRVYDYTSNPAWFRLRLVGSMIAAERTIYIHTDALRAALKTYAEHQEKVVYPEETVIVGEHRIDGRHIETAVMKKRYDGYWDFFLYDEEGNLARETVTPPRPLKAPTQCMGCHLGSKPFEPEKSFPAPASPGPHGPRVVYVEESLKQPDVVAFFDEHAKRSDSVLGLYGTLFVSALRLQREQATISEEDRQLLESLEAFRDGSGE